jgi:hypothetical protein
VDAGDEGIVDLADAVCGEEEEAFEVFHTAEKCLSHIVSVGLFSSTADLGKVADLSLDRCGIGLYFCVVRGKCRLRPLETPRSRLRRDRTRW